MALAEVVSFCSSSVNSSFIRCSRFVFQHFNSPFKWPYGLLFFFHFLYTFDQKLRRNTATSFSTELTFSLSNVLRA